MDQIKIGKFIARLRKEQNMTQLDLATKLGVTDRAVSKWENGRGLPDISLIKPLCDTLDISINELLSGERIAEEQTIKVVDQNVLGVLTDREREIKKRKQISALCIILAVVTVIFSLVYIFFSGTMLYAELRGDGYSFSAAQATQKAERVVKLIYNGDYEKASEFIGFHTKDRDTAEKQWCDAMDELLGLELTIKHFTVSPAIEDDEFISGDGALIIYDTESQNNYIFDLGYAHQDGGITFGIGNIDSYDSLNGSRAAEIAQLIDEVLCTWYAG